MHRSTAPCLFNFYLSLPASLSILYCYSSQALGCTVRLGPATSIDDALHTLAQRVSDSMPSVRSCLVDILADWLLHQPDRYSSHNNTLSLSAICQVLYTGDD